jgi:hypothetical protein
MDSGGGWKKLHLSGKSNFKYHNHRTELRQEWKVVQHKGKLNEDRFN